ncbi:hypothetical protein HY345_04535 [Candidatus Microgenomates bacterium]|nr:hypothetical protein [Candidatus Microgenomates bacterium]
MQINFGEILGNKKGVVQIDYYYQKGDLIGKKVIASVNIVSFPIGPWISEVQILTVCDSQGKRILVVPEKQAIEIGKPLNI